MTIDLMNLASVAVTSFLLPYVKLGAEKIADAFTSRLGEQAADRVADLPAKVWATVTGAFKSSEEETTLNLFKKHPDKMQAMLIELLHEKLSQDATLAQSLADLINKPAGDGTMTGAQIMQAGIAGIADLRNANLANAQNVTISGVTIGDPSVGSAKPKSNG